MPKDRTESKPPRPSWRDLVPEDDPDGDDATWLTRGELLAALAGAGEEVTERTLLRWEHAGALPRPLVKWRDRKLALYPPVAFGAVRWVRRLRDQGRSLAEAGDHVRGMVAETLASPHPSRSPTARRNAAYDRMVEAIAAYAETLDRPTSGAEVRVFFADGTTGRLPVLPWLASPDGG